MKMTLDETKTRLNELKSRGSTIFANRLWTVLWEDGISQSELARTIGIHVTSLRKYITAEGFPRAEKVYAIADALHVSVGYLLGTQRERY